MKRYIFFFFVLLTSLAGCVDSAPAPELSGVGHSRGSEAYSVYDKNAARVATNTSNMLEEVKIIREILDEEEEMHEREVLDRETAERLIEALNRHSEALEKFAESNQSQQ